MKNYICALVFSFVIITPLLAQDKPTDVRSVAVATSEVHKPTSRVGTVFALKTVVLASFSGGLVEKIFLEEGNTVKKGQVLAHIGTIDSKLSLAEAKNFLAHQKTNLLYEQKNWTRQAEFYKKGIINLAQFERTENQYKLTQIAEKSASLKVRKAKINYDRSIIKTPISGIIDEKFFEVGEFASPGNKVYKVIRDDKLQIEFSINENELQSFQVGQKGTIYFDAVAGKYQGVIQKISPSANARTKTFQVKIVLDNKEKKIRPGITARIELNIIKAGKHILIPLAAIIESSRGRLVFLREGEKAKEVLIGTEENIGSKVLVKSGLKVGDRLIVQGQQFLNNNDKINDLAK